MNSELAPKAAEDLAVMPIIRRLYNEIGLNQVIPEEVLDSGMQELQASGLQLAVEVMQAEMRKVPLHVAANDEINYPHLYRLHVLVADCITLELPAAVREWAAEALTLQEVKSGDELFGVLGRMAADSSRPAVSRALAKLALFEALRMGLLMQHHLTKAELVRSGVERDDIDRTADESVGWWITESAAREGTRPLPLLLAESMMQLETYAEAVRTVLINAQPGYVEELERLRLVEEQLQEMNSPDALLLRNHLADKGIVPEQYVKIETLQRLHPDVLGTRERNALDKQLSRILVKIDDGVLPTRKKAALIDLIQAQTEKDSK